MEEADGVALTSIGMSLIFSTTIDANSKPEKENIIPFTIVANAIELLIDF